jgi:hypothetical protein
MFPYQQMAAPMMPQAQGIICGWYTCEWGSCLRTCAWTCAIQSCGYSRVITTPFLPVEEQAQDPAGELERLRKNLELALAGVQAQERLLNEWKSEAKAEEGRKSGRK